MATAPHTAPPTEEELRQKLRAATVLLDSQQIGPALAAYEGVLPYFPTQPEVIFPTAVLRYMQGKDAEATDLVQSYFRAQPVVELEPGHATQRPLMLKVRGYNDTRPQLTREEDGSVRVRMRGGHFSTQYLLEGSGIAECTYNIAAGDDIRAELMPEHDVLLNVISDPDVEGPALSSLERFLAKGYDGPVLNQPAQVRRTTRDENYKRLQGFENLTFPETHRLSFENAGMEEVARTVAALGLKCPFILRRTGTQSGRTTGLINSRDDLTAYVGDGLTGDFFAITYIQLLWEEEYFRKLRLLSIDGQFYPSVCHLDKTWCVHGSNRKTIMLNDERLRGEEQRFLSDWRSYVGAKAVDVLERVAEDTGLEFFGIDFTIDEEGCPLIYELNPSMRHSFKYWQTSEYKQQYDQAVSDAFAAMIRGRMAAKTSSGAS